MLIRTTVAFLYWSPTNWSIVTPDLNEAFSILTTTAHPMFFFLSLSLFMGPFPGNLEISCDALKKIPLLICMGSGVGPASLGTRTNMGYLLGILKRTINISRWRGGVRGVLITTCRLYEVKVESQDFLRQLA